MKTHIFIPADQKDQANDICKNYTEGNVFHEPASSDGEDPATYYFTSWNDAPSGVLIDLEAMGAVTYPEIITFDQSLIEMGLKKILPEIL